MKMAPKYRNAFEDSYQLVKPFPDLTFWEYLIASSFKQPTPKIHGQVYIILGIHDFDSSQAKEKIWLYWKIGPKFTLSLQQAPNCCFASLPSCSCYQVKLGLRIFSWVIILEARHFDMGQGAIITKKKLANMADSARQFSQPLGMLERVHGSYSR